MKELKLEDQIYLCKYHDVDKHLYNTLGLKEDEVEELINYYKKRGLYGQYRNMPDEEYSRLIKKTAMKKIEKKKENKQEEGKIPQQRNQLLDLNDMLFEQLNILMDDSLTEVELNKELRRSKQVVAVSQTIINNADLLLQAKKHFDKTETKGNEVASLLRLDK